MKKILLFAFLFLGLANASGYCYQETANVSNNCDFGRVTLGTGSYSFYGPWNSEKNLVDGDYGTLAFAGEGYCYINYSKPVWIENATWRVKLNQTVTDANYTIPGSCYNANTSVLEFKIETHNAALPNYYSAGRCWNGTDWELVVNGSDGPQIYEEGIYWTYKENTTLVTCGASPNNTQSLVFVQKNSLTNQVLLGDISTNISIIGSEGFLSNPFFSVTNSNLTLCILPNTTTGNVSLLLEFKKAGYMNGTYLFSGQISNVSQNISLYNVLNDGTQELTVIRVLSGDNTLLPGSTVRIYVNDLIQGNQTQIQGVITDSEAKTVQYLVPNTVTYSFEIDWNGNTYYIPKILLTCSNAVCPPYSLDLKAVGLDSSDYYKTLSQVLASCAVNSTNWLVCSVNDSSGLVKTFQLVVDKRNVLNLTRICDQNCTNAQCILRCNLGNTSNAIYQYAVRFYASPKQTALSGMLDYLNRLIDWGSMGVFLAFLLLLTLYFAGSWNPTVAMLIAYVGLIFSYLIGLLPISLEPLVGLGFVIAVIVWKMGL